MRFHHNINHLEVEQWLYMYNLLNVLSIWQKFDRNWCFGRWLNPTLAPLLSNQFRVVEWNHPIAQTMRWNFSNNFSSSVYFCSIHRKCGMLTFRKRSIARVRHRGRASDNGMRFCWNDDVMNLLHGIHLFCE